MAKIPSNNTGVVVKIKFRDQRRLVEKRLLVIQSAQTLQELSNS